MPPVTKAGGSAFQKDVEFVSKDDDEQVAAGIVMVPDKADLQHDFAREETIRGFSDQFETFYEAGEAGGGIMHAVFPDDWMDLERNEVLDEAEEIGGEEVPAGAWVQEWRINNDDQWSLIKDDVLSGYSIGAIQVEWNGPFEQDDDEVDDVEVPEEIEEDALIWELADGIIREVSNVDIPAVPDAQILEAKADRTKRLGDYLGDRDSFVEEALQRGHSEEDAERLWDVLNEAVEVEGSNQPGKDSVLARAGKAFLKALSTPDPTPGSDDGQTAAAPEAPADEQTDKDAPGGDTPDDDGGQEAAADMTDKDDTTPDDGGEGDEKALAEQNAEQISELTAAVEELTETLAGPQPKTAEIELDGETYEVPEDQVKAALGVDEDAGVSVADAIESLKADVEEAHGRLDTISRQSGVSQQIESSQNGDGEDDKTGLEALGKGLS